MTVPLIRASDLHSLLKTKDVVVLDATALLPGETTDPELGFATARIPGARRFDIERFSDPGTSLPHMAPAAGRFARLAGELGLTREQAIVVYDQGNIASSCRAWWLFRLFGHDRVQVLDGGLPAWREAGGDVESGATPPITATTYTPRLTVSSLRGLGDMLSLCAAPDGTVILDARSKGRFEGTAPEPRAGLSSGHMPGSRNLPFGELLDPTRHFLSPERLGTRFAKAGAKPGTPLVASCGSGMTASVLVVAATVVGLGPVSLYDGSWAEWAATAGAPIETGAETTS
ncbi:thiosulfate sulfurtransferase [Acetobacter estunensis NRIC 0472]|uniref:Sulfurtransferase n=1 Tax=Acetobacter estunensis TaxID=104097 RepID=A0A967B754_9PROT|nr:sulfurtransferase [Acetobacter estunensis]NHO53629.1 sulfurtransferase [Acetobacter estunensis]GBQ25065.1 thiosulfate sulfurtransferase [Acetobacter estunensis NRIC 0472]